MNQIKALIVSAALMSGTPVLQAQDTTAKTISNMPDERVQVAFRKVDRKDLPGGISAVDVASQMKLNYMTYSLENMDGWVNGFNGNSMWGMGSYLLVIDGVPREAGNVMPTEIEQISFLKGVNAVALYGSRAAKGVVYITTKRGKPGNQRIDIRANAGVNVPKAYPHYLGSAEYMTLYNEARRNDGLAELYSPETIYNYAAGKNPYRYPNVDYYSDKYLKNAFGRYDVTAEISGGNDKARYYTNIGYQTNGSLLNFGEAVNNGKSDRLNLRGNVDVNLNQYISCNVDAAAIFYTGRGVNTNYWESAATLRPHRFAPLIPLDMIETTDEASNVFVKNSNHIIDGKYLLGGTQLDQTNPFAAIYAGGNNRYISRQFQFNTGVNADLRNLLKGLSFRSTFAVDYNTSYNLAFNNTYAVYAPTWNNYSGVDLISSLTQYGQDATSGVQNVSNSWYRQTIAASGQFNYVNTIGNRHHLSAVLLVNGFQQSESAVYHRVSNANLGLQLGYNLSRTYYIDFSSAVVHSAKLPEGNRTAFSPTVSLGWRLSNEPFMRGVRGVDDLRLTASAGVLHTDLDIDNYYLYQGVYTNTQGSWFGWKDGTGVQATESRRGANPDMRFPKREEISIGLEGSFFHNLIKLDGNFFLNKITGNIIQPNVLFPSYFTTGWPVSSFIPYINYNDDKRMGVDFNLSLNKKLSAINYSIGLVGTYYKTTATKRAETYEDNYQYRQGRPLDAIWGLQHQGFFQDADDIKNSPSQTFGQVKPGDIKYKDQNGDGVIDTRDEVYLGRGGWFGSPLTLGVNVSVKWKQFSFFALGQGRFGSYGMKNSSWFWVDGEDKYSEVVRDRWTPETAGSAKYPRLTTFNSDNNFRNSDFWLYKANRIDLAKVQISYDMSDLIGNKKIVKEMGVYVSGFNLLTLSAERKLMEMNIGSAPQTRLYNLGVKAMF
ncbi:SusC/RagA family TonB-linked outer membrane protein [Chitinophaga ginsengisegetis]|uniref:SusC/RagA family TonB-linked outer membrane protein n=1 Tax=Chitinophaga ginsengisegetis TaxID=393003 RepID=UPI000DB90912|nr:SusC/RagA family TonB-linked outer membrane protein [Chitinophaga ginsengisegetis]MDR6568751.1 TonB-linked SusC/RagA family outer membrane protein [Chitinophaga ginsengisegetis]MDR6648018.1 TonB-linked SusC/RagA family outer membrane protein [Chitinophaga ginsengisegetis]MDR6654832.1 TonB-linked SusC/RagA family outer membrane protein [Chitinophaga ginsengisegetis]